MEAPIGLPISPWAASSFGHFTSDEFISPRACVLISMPRLSFLFHTINDCEPRLCQQTSSTLCGWRSKLVIRYRAFANEPFSFSLQPPTPYARSRGASTS